MLTTSKVNSRKRDKLFECTLTTVRDAIDRYEQSNMQEIVYLRPYQSILQDGWNRFQSIRNELYELEEADFAQQLEALKLYLSQANRIRELMEGKRPSNTSIPKCSSDPSNNVQRSDNNGHIPPTEIVASSQMPIPSHSTRSSQHDIRNMSTTRDLTTTFAASASQPSDSTPQNSLNQSIRDLLDRKELNSIQDDYGRTPPTEGTASTQLPIPAYTTRSSPHDTRNVSTTRDRTTTLTASASQPSGSTTQNVSNQPNAPDLQDQKELNHAPDKNSDTPPGNTTLHVTPDMDIISESRSPRPNVKNSPSPRRRGATPASNPNRDNLHVITTII